MDGASNNKDTDIDFILATQEGSIIEQSYTLGFSATNINKYEDVITSLKLAATLGVMGLEVYCDSLLE